MKNEDQTDIFHLFDPSTMEEKKRKVVNSHLILDSAIIKQNLFYISIDLSLQEV